MSRPSQELAHGADGPARVIAFGASNVAPASSRTVAPLLILSGWLR